MANILALLKNVGVLAVSVAGAPNRAVVTWLSSERVASWNWSAAEAEIGVPDASALAEDPLPDAAPVLDEAPVLEAAVLGPAAFEPVCAVAAGAGGVGAENGSAAGTYPKYVVPLAGEMLLMP
jgi:hypothetical protein